MGAIIPIIKRGTNLVAAYNDELDKKEMER